MDTDTLPNSPYVIVEDLRWKSRLQNLTCILSVTCILKLLYPHTSQPYNSIGTKILSNKCNLSSQERSNWLPYIMTGVTHRFVESVVNLDVEGPIGRQRGP